jgi:hypothetical protein
MNSSGGELGAPDTLFQAHMVANSKSMPLQASVFSDSNDLDLSGETSMSTAHGVQEVCKKQEKKKIDGAKRQSGKALYERPKTIVQLTSTAAQIDNTIDEAEYSTATFEEGCRLMEQTQTVIEDKLTPICSTVDSAFFAKRRKMLSTPGDISYSNTVMTSASCSAAVRQLCHGPHLHHCPNLDSRASASNYVDDNYERAFPFLPVLRETDPPFGSRHVLHNWHLRDHLLTETKWPLHALGTDEQDSAPGSSIGRSPASSCFDKSSVKTSKRPRETVSVATITPPSLVFSQQLGNSTSTESNNSGNNLSEIEIIGSDAPT